MNFGNWRAGCVCPAVPINLRWPRSSFIFSCGGQFFEGASCSSWCTSIRFFQVVVVRLGRSLMMTAGFSNEHNSSSQPCCCMSFFLGSLTFTFIHMYIDIDDNFSMMVSIGTCDHHYTKDIWIVYQLSQLELVTSWYHFQDFSLFAACFWLSSFQGWRSRTFATGWWTLWKSRWKGLEKIGKEECLGHVM